MQGNKYILKQKEYPVANISINPVSFTIDKIIEIYDVDRLPFGIIDAEKSIINQDILLKNLNNWWIRRSIPASRDGLRSALEYLNINMPQELLIKGLGLSLSDQYWITNPNADVKWQEVNFFENVFSEDMGNVLLGDTRQRDEIDLLSPDNTSDGWLKKKWTIIDGKRCLLKSGSGTEQQEPLNEVIASILMNKLELNHVDYSLIKRNDDFFSVCETFIDTDTELIPAAYILYNKHKPNHISPYDHFFSACKELGLPDFKNDIHKMLVVDFLIVNEDRHYHNFGFIRNVETLDIQSFAPIYDNGTSLWYRTPTYNIGSNKRNNSKPFRSNHERQIELVKSFGWLDFDQLNNLKEDVLDYYYSSPYSQTANISEDRIKRITTSMNNRIHELKQYIKLHENKIYRIEHEEPDI